MRELLKADKVLFFLGMIASCLFSYYFRNNMSPSKCSADYRRLVSFFGGVFLIIFCFGTQIVHLFIPMSAVYVSMKLLDTRTSFYFSSVFSMLYLTLHHLWRMYYDYGGYELDITGPLMVLVQRLTMLAANLDDGQTLKKQKLERERPLIDALAHSTPKNPTSKSPTLESKLSENQRRLALCQLPNPLQFISYCINFQTVIIGPLITYRDYDIFIRGTEADHLKTNEQRIFFTKNREKILEARDVIITYGKQVIMYGFLYIFVAGYFPTSFYLSDEFLQYSYTKRLGYLLLTSNFMRQQYYFGWSVCALCCLLSGLGFSGLDSDNNPRYTLVKNFRFRSVEFAGSLKELIDNWNISTCHWLRLVIFDRCPKSFASPVVFAASCIWHGFYPGYYMFFISMGYFTYLSRLFHRHIRPKMFKKLLGRPPPDHPKEQNWLERTNLFNVLMSALGFPVMSTGNTGAAAGTGATASKNDDRLQLDTFTSQFCQRYDFFTWAVTYLVVNYSATAFVILAFHDALIVWARLFFIVHFFAIGLHMILVNHRIIR